MGENLRTGDPSGRRLWRAQANKLSEAHAMARALDILLADANIGVDLSKQLLAAIEKQEMIALQRAYGPIAPRKRFKGQKPHALLEDRPINCLYVDEAGKSTREPPSSPSFFSLGAVAIDEAECARYCERADSIKQEFFGTQNHTFHEPRIRNHNGEYYFDGDVGKQNEFDAAIDRLIDETDFMVFGVGVRKNAFQEQFADTGVDPYLPTDAYALAIVLLLERYVDYIASREPRLVGRITFESQGPREDAYHQLEYARVLMDGSQWLAPAAFRSWLETGLRFVPKRGSEPTELADMVSRDLYEWIRSDCKATPARWERLSRKVYCRGDGRMGKFGIKVFPDHDIRDRIDAHRQECGATEN